MTFGETFRELNATQWGLSIFIRRVPNLRKGDSAGENDGSAGHDNGDGNNGNNGNNNNNNNDNNPPTTANNGNNNNNDNNPPTTATNKRRTTITATILPKHLAVATITTTVTTTTATIHRLLPATKRKMMSPL